MKGFYHTFTVTLTVIKDAEKMMFYKRIKLDVPFPSKDFKLSEKGDKSLKTSVTKIKKECPFSFQK